jgi:peptidyl-prolyl cis-trans isomerase D
MLKFLSKRRRSRKALLWGFVILLALGLVVTFTPAFTGSAALGDDTVLVEVADYDVTLKEFRQALAGISEQAAAGRGGAAQADDPSMIFDLYGPRVLNDLIQQKLIFHEADQHNMMATDWEIQEKLKQLFFPWPGYDQYRARLQQMGFTTSQYEDMVRRSITAEKLRSFVTAGVQVSPQEVEEDYRRNNTNYTVRWVEVNPDKFRDQVQITDSDLLAYFNQNKDLFRISTEQRRARYIFIDQAKAGEAVQVSDDELRQNFNPERGVQQVRVSQIVLDLPKAQQPAAAPATQQPAEQKPALTKEEVSQKADQIVQRAQGGDGKPPEDFARLVREFSQDAKTRTSGGDLGWVNKKDKRDADDPLNRVFSMQKDEVSQPIIKGDRLYILKVTDRKVPTFEESREQLLKEVRVQKGYTRAVEIAIDAEQRLKESKNLDAVAAEINNKYGVEVASVKETPFFAPGDNIPDLGAASELATAIFDFENQGEITDRLSVNNGFAIAQYTDRRDPHDAVFEEVRSKVEDRYRTDKAKELAAERARQIAQAQSLDALKSAGDAMKLTTEERAGLTGNDSIGPLISESDRARIYALKVGEVTREPIKPAEGEIYVVAGLVSRKDADMGEPFQKERASIEQRLLDAKRNALFTSYLAAAQKRLTDQGEIEVHRDRILEAVESGAAGSGMPQGQGGVPIAPGRSGSFPPARPAPRRTAPGSQAPPQ